MSDIYTIIVHSLKKGNHSLKAVLINSVGEVDYSVQETCHILLQLPLIKASRDSTVVKLDGSCVIEYHLQEIERASLPSFLDHYLVPPTTPLLMTLTFFSSFSSTLYQRYLDLFLTTEVI